ncbi:unnamed protein product [Anisakis simplex]|uniref:Uncharacterized protein n=1 Tax=Anisakis simplex TaxID=6269 RepID=A0A0M3JZD5_ANISI|nr:unnamed protein product [Anisakis simplex]
MGDYSLTRARSAVVLRSRSIERPSTLLITRTRSVPDLTRYVSTSYKYRPHWPYRYYRDYDLYDDYWYDRYYYFSPLYKSSLFPRRYYYSDYLPNPYYWSWPSHYWTRYKGYWYDYDYPTYYYRRYYDPSYDSYFRSIYTPYRYNAFDSWYTSLNRGLSMYRQGLVPYSTVDRYWLTPSYWDRRFRDWRQMHSGETTKERDYTPTKVAEESGRQYVASWKS